MLKSAIGRSRLERGKSALIVALATGLVLSLVELGGERAATGQQRNDVERAGAVAREFALALTTYDYAHLSAQRSALVDIASESVMNQIASATRDVVNGRAWSTGDVTETTVVWARYSAARVLVSTSQLTGNFNTVQNTARLLGLLDLTLKSIDGTWIVTAYSWRLSPSDEP